MTLLVQSILEYMYCMYNWTIIFDNCNIGNWLVLVFVSGHSMHTRARQEAVSSGLCVRSFNLVPGQFANVQSQRNSFVIRVL